MPRVQPVNTFPVKKGQVIEAGEGSSFTAKHDGLAYWDGDDLRMVDAAITHKPNTAPPAAQQAVLVDAERYRLLRRGQRWSVIDGIGDTLRAEELDAAVDAARATLSAGKGGM